MQDHTQKVMKVKRARDIAQVIEYLPGKHKALNSNPKTTKKREKIRDVFLIMPQAPRKLF
jgi:hypothetical protein